MIMSTSSIKTKKAHIKQVLRLVSAYEFAIYAVVIKKSRLKITPKNLYNNTISELLRLMPLKNASIKVDGHSGTNYTKRAISQIRKNANIDDGQIKEIKFGDSKENILLQLADLVAGSIFRSIQRQKADHKDYVDILTEHIIEIRQS